jgi:undecaprenyl pyrophosphate synthase
VTDTDVEQLRKALFKLMREQSKYFFSTHAWIRLEAEIDAISDQINNYYEKE